MEKILYPKYQKLLAGFLYNTFNERASDTDSSKNPDVVMQDVSVALSMNVALYVEKLLRESGIVYNSDGGGGSPEYPDIEITLDEITKKYLRDNYVTVKDSQVVEGEKDFRSGIRISGRKIFWDEGNNALCIDGAAYTTGWFSAKGISPGGGGPGTGGGVLNLFQLLDVKPNEEKTSVLGAEKGNVLTYDGNMWYGAKPSGGGDSRLFTALDKDGNVVLSSDETTEIYAIRANYNLWSVGSLSAKGVSIGGGGGGGGGALTIYQLLDVEKNASGDGVLGAKKGTSLMFNGDKWYAGEPDIPKGLNYLFSALDSSGNVLDLNDEAIIDRIYSIRANYSFWTTGWLSAKGISEGSGGGGGASSLYQLLDVQANSSGTGVEGAVTNSILTFNGSHWIATNSVYVSSARTINTTKGITGGGNLSSDLTLSLTTTGVTSGSYSKVSVDAYGRVTAGTTLADTDIPNLDWSKITTGKPTTLAGYGITDAYTKTESDGKYVTLNTVQTITESKTFSKQVGFSNNNNALYPHIYGNGSYLFIGGKNDINSSIVFDGNNKLYPYKDGSIDCGSSANRWATLWSVNGKFSGKINISGIGYPQIYGNGTYLMLSSTDDITKSIVISTSSMYPNSTLGISLGAPTNKWAGVFSSNGTFDDFIQVGDAQIRWDGSKKAVYVINKDGTTAVGLYSTGWLSAKGISEGSGGGGGLIQTVYGYSDLGGTFDSSSRTDTFNADTTNKLAGRITTLENSVPKDVVTLSTAQTITGAKTFSTTLSFTNGDVNIKGNGTWLKLSNNTTPRIQIGDLNMLPCVDNATDLGGSAFRWRNIYSTKGYFTDQITSTVANGTAPFVVSSSTTCMNLNAHYVGGRDSNGLAHFQQMSEDANNVVSTVGLLLSTVNTATAPGIIGGNSWLMFKQVKSTNSVNYDSELAFGFGSDYLAIRRKNNTATWGAWKKVSAGFADVATKLQTPRTIWGQTFDGTGNVSGDLTLGYKSIRDGKGAIIFSSSTDNTVRIESSGNFLYLGGSTTAGILFTCRDKSDAAIMTANGKLSLGGHYSSSITLALGDSDTGFNWVSDGDYRFVANGQTAAGITSSGFYAYKTLYSAVTGGTAPISVSTTAMCPNLNADLLDGFHANVFSRLDGANFYSQYNEYDYLEVLRYTITPSVSLRDYVLLSVTRTETGADQRGEVLFRIRKNSTDAVSFVFSTTNFGSSSLPEFRITSDDNITFKLWVKCAKAGYDPYLCIKIKDICMLDRLVFSGKSGITGTPSGSKQNVVSNVQTNIAFALADTRTIWGQSFNGTQNVNGRFELNGVTSSNFSIYDDGGINLQSYGGRLLSINKAGNNIIFGNVANLAKFNYGGTSFYNVNGDATLAMYAGLGLSGNETICLQTTFDGQDPVSSSYPSGYPQRAILALQPRGGRVALGKTTASYPLDVIGSILCSDWIRTSGKVGWYNETYSGGIYMEDSTYVRVWNNKRFFSSGGFEINYEGSSWISMATRTNCIIANQNNSSASAHALFRTKFNNGNVLAYGGLGNEMGFYGFSAYNVANGVNEVTWKARWDSNGNFYNQGRIGTSDRVYAHGQAYTLAWNTVFNPDNSTYGDRELNTVSNNQYKPMLGWHDQISGQGYITKYNIGSYRSASGYTWGKMILAVSNNDYGNSIGAEVDISGDGWVDVGPKLRINGLPIYKYSDGVLYFDCSIAARGGIAAGIAGGSGVPVPTVTQTGNTFQFTESVGYLKDSSSRSVIKTEYGYSYLGDSSHAQIQLQTNGGRLSLWSNGAATIGNVNIQPTINTYLACWGRNAGTASYIYVGVEGSAMNTGEIEYYHYGNGNSSNQFSLGFWGGTSYGRLRLRASGANFLDGSLTASGSITPGSDIRRKNITRDNIRLTLDQIANAPSIEFLWKDLPFDTSTHCGTTAQYWLGVLPSSVNTKDPDYLSLDYNGLTMIASISLANEIKELKKENEELKKELEVIRSFLTIKDN